MATRVVPIKLDPASVRVSYKGRQFFVSLALVAFAFAMLILTASQSEYGRPSWWTGAMLPIVVVLLSIVTVRNLWRWLQALGIAPLAAVAVGDSYRVGSPWAVALNGGAAVPSAAPPRITIELRDIQFQRVGGHVVGITLGVGTRTVWRAIVPSINPAFGWEAWAEREFGVIPGLAVTRAQ